MNYTLVYTSAAGSIEFSIDSGFVVETFDSPYAVDVEFATAKGSQTYGVKVESQQAMPKTISISGTILGDAREKRKKLLRVLAPMQPGKLQFNGQHFMNVYPKQSPTVERYDTNPRFSFMLYAPVPFWHNSGGTSTQMYGVEGLFSFPWDWGSTFQFSSIRNGTVNVVNDGDAPCTWELTVVALGDVENPCITKTRTGEFVRVNVSLTAGQKLLVSTVDDEMTVVKADEEGNEVDIFNSLDIDSTRFLLDVGDNLLDFTPASESVKATVNFYKNYVGV